MATTNLSQNTFQVTAAIAFFTCLTFSGCGKETENSRGSSEAGGSTRKRTVLHSTGSDTMVTLAQAWADAYSRVNPDVFVEVSGGGSGAGFTALIKGTVDFVYASREIKPAEAQQLKKNTGKDAREFVVAYDALAIYVHKDNPLNEISQEQLAAIYGEGGNITKWSQLGVAVPGCHNDEILLVSRQSISGTYEFLREHVLQNKNFKPGAREVSDSRQLVDLVASMPCAIGYSGMSYAKPKVKMLKVSSRQGQPAHAPSIETTRNKTYPLTRSLQIYTVGEPHGALKQYLHWVMSEPGQQIVEIQGFVPIPATERNR